MPVSNGDARDVRGRDEYLQTQRGRPVSGHLPRVPRQPAGVVWRVENQSWDAHATLAAGTVMLLAGSHLACVAARIRDAPVPSLATPPLHPGRSAAGIGRLLPRSVVLARDPSAGAMQSDAQQAPALHAFHPAVLPQIRHPLAELAEQEALLVAEESVGDGRSLLWQGIAAWFADPCTDLDQYANGFWKLQHPAGPVAPSFFSEAKKVLQAQMLEELPHASPDAPGAEQALALTWASARDVGGWSWSAFAAQRDEIAALASMDDVMQHICASMLKGQESVLGLERYFRAGVLVVGLALQPAEPAGLYGFPPAHPAVLAHKADIARLLVHTGMPQGEAEQAAGGIFDMEAELARVPMEPMRMGSYSLSQAILALPGFPWAKVWSALRLDPMTALFTSVETCRSLDGLLSSRSLLEWKAFLRCQQARRMEHLLQTGREPGQLLHRLEDSRGGRRLLGAWYGSSAAPALETRARALFEGVKQVYLEDLAASSLPVEDIRLLQEVLHDASLRLDDGRDMEWSGFEASPSFAINLQRLAGLKVREDIEIIEDPAGASRAGSPAHHLAMGTNVLDGQVFTTPALLRSVQTGATSAEHEWATLGVMFGHELGHLMVDGCTLSAVGAAMMEQENAAIGQRIGDLWSSEPQLDAQRMRGEAACDLRGLSAGRRAGEAEAAREGRAFDHRRFFVAAAGLHAANPTAAQLRAKISEDHHPPGPFRAELGRSLKAFDEAFGCEPRPSTPFDRMFTQAAPVQAAADPNTG